MRTDTRMIAAAIVVAAVVMAIALVTTSRAGAAGGGPTIYYRRGAQLSLPPSSSTVAAVACPAGTKVVGGGAAADYSVRIERSFPGKADGTTAFNGWSVLAYNSYVSSQNLRVYAICMEGKKNADYAAGLAPN